MVCIIKAITIVYYDASFVICQLKTSGYDASIIITTLEDFHNSERFDASIVNTTSYFYNTGHWMYMLKHNSFNKYSIS